MSTEEKISVEKMATGMYASFFIHNSVKEELKDADGNLLLSKEERILLLLCILCRLLEVRGLNDVKIRLLSIFTNENRGVKNEGDLVIEMALVAKSMEQVNKMFWPIPKEIQEFIKRDWAFNKNLNPVQKFSIFVWYFEHIKTIDSIFKSFHEKFVVALEQDSIK